MSKRSGKRKITVGWVVQTFDNNNKCTEQEFHAGDQVDYEDDEGNSIDEWDEYQSYDMVQPQAMAVAMVGNMSDGYGVVGPFTDWDEAARWAEGQESWILTMQSPYEEFDSAKIPATEIPVIGTLKEDGQVVFNKDITPEIIRDLVKTLENPRRSLQIRVESVARQIKAFRSKED